VFASQYSFTPLSISKDECVICTLRTEAHEGSRAAVAAGRLDHPMPSFATDGRDDAAHEAGLRQGERGWPVCAERSSCNHLADVVTGPVANKSSVAFS